MPGYELKTLFDSQAQVKKAVLQVGALSAILLIIFLIAFVSLDQILPLLSVLGIASTADAINLPNIAGMQLSISKAGLRVLLGGGAVFFQFIIIVTSMFDRIMDTLKAVVRPITILVPLIAFLFSAYQTLDPVVKSLLPTEITGASVDFASTVNQAEFSRNVILTFGTMVLYLLFARIFRPESDEVKSLRAEIRRLKRRSG